MALVILRKYRKIAFSLLFFSMLSLLLLSLPLVSISLLNTLETQAPLDNLNFKNFLNSQSKQHAIVVLSAGRQLSAIEYGAVDAVSAQTLQRLNYASWLNKKLDLPILLSGGSGTNQATSEAVLMNQVMNASFSVSPRWIEAESKNIAENARYSAEILRNNSINDIVLVTHAKQMRRAKLVFQKQGINVIPAPIVFSSIEEQAVYLPNTSALHRSTEALHEILLLAWYKIYY